MCSAASAWLAKLMSITVAGCPSAAARLTSRPSASRKISRPSFGRGGPRRTGAPRTSRSVIASRSPLLISTSKWPELADDRAATSSRRTSRPSIASRSPVTEMKMSPTLAASTRGHHLEAVHHGLERTQRVDLADDDVGAVALGAHRDAVAAPAVADHDDAEPGDQHVGRPDHAVERRLAGAVAVVEEVLGVGVVDGDDRDSRACPRASSAFSRITPVVVSSVPPSTSASCSERSPWRTPTTSAPSSMVICGVLVDRGRGCGGSRCRCPRR